MKKHIRFIAFMLGLTVCVCLTSCWLLDDPFGEADTASDTTPIGETYVDSAIHPSETTELPDMGTNPTVTEPDIRTLYGVVVAYTGEEPMENVLAVEVWRSGKRETVYVYTDRASEFCVNDEVSFTYDANAEPMDSYDGVAVLEALRIELMIEVAEKPVIYLYPETPTACSVKLTVDGELTCTYPAYGTEGWSDFTAYPDGTLIFPDGKEYYCLYWEAVQNADYNFSQGFCVKGEDTAAFLEWALSEMGLTAREANEFIIYWLPRMERNAYNVISFQTETYTEGAILDIDPAPDSLLRVFMAYYPSDVAVEMEAQKFEGFDRMGFTVVEWGGCDLTEAP